MESKAPYSPAQKQEKYDVFLNLSEFITIFASYYKKTQNTMPITISTKLLHLAGSTSRPTVSVQLAIGLQRNCNVTTDLPITEIVKLK